MRVPGVPLQGKMEYLLQVMDLIMQYEGMDDMLIFSQKPHLMKSIHSNVLYSDYFFMHGKMHKLDNLGKNKCSLRKK